MGDSRRSYRAVKRAILQQYPTKPQGNLARQFITWVDLVSGIALSKSCQLSTPGALSLAPESVR